MVVKVKERPLGSGIYWIFIAHQNKLNAKKIEAKLTFGDLDLAKEEKKVPTFKEYGEIWFATYVKPLRRLSTDERYLNTC